MKKIIFLLFIVGAIYAQQVPENKTVYPNRWGCITQNTNTSNTKTYSYSTETNVGREIVVVDSADTTFNAYRSYFYFNAVALPSNATNISVRVTTITSFTDGFSFTLKKPSTINQSTASTAWDQIRDGVQMLPISISYGTNTNFSSEIQAAFVSSFENGKDFIIAVYNPSDSSEANTKSMFSISLEVTYVRPAVLNSFNVDNIPSGGSVNVDRDGYTFNLQCPGTFTAYENQAISLEAIDIQVIGGLTYGFNDVEGDSNKSVWGNISAVTGLFEPRTLSQTMSFTGASTLKNLAARLSRFYKMSQRYETELDSTQENQNISYIVKDNSGNVSALPQITINNKLYKYVWWNDNWNLGISRRVTPNNDMTFTAMYKCPSHSNSNLAFSKNSERKVIKSVGEIDALHKVYESMGHVWYERSTDNGNTWTIMNNGKPLDDFQGKNPSIDYYPNYEKVVVAFQNEDVNTGEAQIKVVNFIMGTKVGESYPVTSYFACIC